LTIERLVQVRTTVIRDRVTILGFVQRTTKSHKVKIQELAIMSVILGGWGVKINDKNNQ